MSQRASLAVGLVLFLAICAPILAFVALAPDVAIVDYFGDDDSYYYFGVARHIAAGLQSSFDGRTTTNGYHPLWMILSAAVWAVVSGSVSDLRVILAVSSGFYCAALWLFVIAIVRLGTGIVPALVAVMPFALARDAGLRVINGSELPLNLFLSAVFLLLLAGALHDGPPGLLRRSSRLGVIGSLLFLARLDNLLLLMLSVLLLNLWLLKEQTPRGALLRFNNQMLTPLMVALTLYTATNLAVFGGILPVSAQVKRYWAAIGGSVFGAYPSSLSAAVIDYLRLTPTGLVNGPVADVYWYLSPLFGGSLVTIAVVLVALAIGVHLAGWRGRSLLLLLVAASLLKAVILLLPGYVQARHWYWSAEYMAAVIYIALGLGGLTAVVRGVRLRTSIQVAVLALTLVPLAPAYLAANRARFQFRSSDGSDYLQRVDYLERRTPPTAVVGTPNAGGLGYYSTRTIVNIDGLINSYEFLESLRHHAAGECLDEIGITHIFIQPVYLQYEPYKSMLGSRLRLLGSWKEDEGASRQDLYAFLSTDATPQTQARRSIQFSCAPIRR